MLKVRVQDHAIQIGRHFAVTFQRTLRIPDDGKVYPLPPGLGRFPVCRVAEFKDRVPAAWKRQGGVFIPMYQREALWMYFQGAHWRPNAVKIGVGKINAVTGKRWDERLRARPQDYLVCPDQPWLDGINAGRGYIRQFVAMPLGMGYTVEVQVSGKEEFGGIQIVVFDPKPGKFPDRPPARGRYAFGVMAAPMVSAPDVEMGLAAGGKMRQKIYEDEHGVTTWDRKKFGRVFVYIVNSMMYREITGMEPPPTPISAKMYTEHGFPWFDLYDEEKSAVAASGILSKVKSVKAIDKEKGFSPQQDDASIKVAKGQVKKLKSHGDD